MSWEKRVGWMNSTGDARHKGKVGLGVGCCSQAEVGNLATGKTGQRSQCHGHSPQGVRTDPAEGR